jgi:hypothetical protein
MNRSFVLGTVATIAIVTSAAHAAPTQTVRFGETAVRLDAGFLGALDTLGVAPSAIGPARLVADRRGNVFAGFPITTGRVDLGTARGEISHVGGLRLRAGNTTVELTDFDIDTTPARPVLTGLVTVNGDLVGRLPLFNLTLPAVSLPLQPQFGVVLQIPGVQLTLTDAAAGALNGVFGITALTGGIPIGLATTTTFVAH